MKSMSSRTVGLVPRSVVLTRLLELGIKPPCACCTGRQQGLLCNTSLNGDKEVCEPALRSADAPRTCRHPRGGTPSDTGSGTLQVIYQPHILSAAKRLKTPGAAVSRS
jgi:hypothetical protein